MNCERRFEEGELILVDVAPSIDHERWVPAVYMYELPTGNHVVRMMSDDGSSKVERPCVTECIRHSDEAVALSVHYEVYADAPGSLASRHATLDSANAAARKMADVDDAVYVVDKVVVGGQSKVAVHHPKGE